MEAPDDTSLVWHYTNGSALMEIIGKNELWASSAAFMNDTDELLSGGIELRRHFEKERPALPPEIVEELGTLIPEGRGRSGESFILSASSDGDSLTMWRYYGRDQVSFAIGLDRKATLVPLARMEQDSHPNPPSGYHDDSYETDDEGRQFLVSDPDYVFIEGGKWAPVVYEPVDQAKVISEVFQTLRAGVEEKSQRSLWFFPVVDESLNLIKNSGFRDEREQRIIVWLNPSWKFVFHRPGPFGLVPYIKLTALPANHDRGDSYATSPARLPIREIRVGPTPYSEEAVSSLRQLLGFHGLHDVEVSHSRIPFRQ